MRNELELISTIEKYLNNELSAEDKAAFERNMSADPQLQEAVALQKEIMKGIENLSLKQNIQQAKNRYYRNRNLTKWGLPGGIVIVTIITILIYSAINNSHSKTGNSFPLPEFNELNEKVWADADSKVAPQKFVITTGSDTIVETKSGMVIQIPANGFLTANKQPVTGQIELTVKEATDAASIIRAGLSSTSGDQLLESAGMFYIDARQNKNILAINPASGLHIEMPSDTVHPGMKLFKGKRLADGRIDWIDPQPLEHDLTPVDINQLNFYPPRYLDSLAKWGYDIKDKKFTDSLYYSLASCFEDSWIVVEDNLALGDHIYSTQENCSVNPAKIKAIWNEKFQNTILATREFEERLYWIHESKRSEALDLYINNLDLKLSEIDSMAALVIYGEARKPFLTFAARKDGKVKINATRSQQLRRYYEAKTKIFMDAVNKTNREYWDKQAQLDKIATDKQTQHRDDSLKRNIRLFTEELNVNLRSAYSQLGYDTSVIPRMPEANVYKMEITAVGWYNVDRYVVESTITRTTLNYRDSTTNKAATIKYQPVSIQIKKPEQYDGVYVYLLPDKLNSFIRLPEVDGKYTEKLNELINYNLIIVAYKDGRPFYYSLPAVEPKTYTGIELLETNANQLNRLLNEEGNRKHETDLQKDIAFYLFYNNDVKRQKHNVTMRELKLKTALVVFTCIAEMREDERGKYYGEETAY